ncbi:NAD-dependent epimerase/dehydratase family protein [Streptomyces sp. NPDC050085]|uniref:NAD-dependent epimerase/dehydratase family protein n=1 Tax=Streptomyces sp. NPDC050085 TaxID=3365600 RepID=UPI0037BD18AC
MSGPDVLLTGATGFIGSKVLRRLVGGGAKVRALTRDAAADLPRADGLTWHTADLSEPASLSGAAEGVGTLIHLASVVSGPESECAAVNVRGTTALMAEARRVGVPRVVHLSTAAVYGPGPHDGPAAHEITPAPVSAASRTRLAGEGPALAAGGIVLRPGLILGAGDRWVVPALADLLDEVPARWDSGRGRLSMVDADDLARLVTALATGARQVDTGVHHASHPHPVRNGDLMARLADLGVLPAAAEDWTWEACLAQLRQSPGRVSERQFALLAQDHWYRGSEIWRLADCPPGPGPLARLAAAAPWYRNHLAGRGSSGTGTAPRRP